MDDLPFYGKSCVVFDFDLTLADSTEGAVQTINAVLTRSGRSMATRDAIRRTIGWSLRDTFAALANADESESVQLLAMFREESDRYMTANTTLLSGARECVCSLVDAGVLLGIVSTKYRFRIAEILGRDGLLSAFACIVGGDDVPVPKPDPGGLLALLARLGIQRDAALYVGDSPIDAELGRRAGVDFVAVLTGVSAREDFGELPVRRFVANLTELAAMVVHPVTR
jgi:phosphoglycolate phosphatase